MNSKGRPGSVWAFPLVALALALVVLGGDWGGWATHLRGGLFDAYQRETTGPRAQLQANTGRKVAVLDIDAASLARFGPWPWPHAVLARLVSRLRAEGADVLALDLPLDRVDPASPANLYAEIPPGPAYDAARSMLGSLDSPDRALAAEIGRMATVQGYTLGKTDAANPVSPRSGVASDGEKNSFARVSSFEAAAGPIAPIAAAARALGARNLSADSDGVVRRMPLVFRLRGVAVASLDAEVLRLVRNRPQLLFHAGNGGSVFSGETQLASLADGAGSIPTAPDGSIWLSFARQGVVPVSAARLDEGALPPGALQHAIVYFGAPDDGVVTPLGWRSSAMVHAQALENLLSGAVLRRPAEASRAELACLALAGLVLAFLLARIGVWWAGLFAGLAIGGAFAVSWQLFTANRVLLDALGPGLGIAFVFVAGAAARALEVGSARTRLHEAFSDSLGMDAIERIARKPQLLRLEGENRNVTYLVCGIRGFAGLAASFRDDPVSFTRLLERVFAPLMDEVLAHRGTIERINAEGFSAFWNAPLDDPEHAIHACEAACGMMEAIARVNDIITHERRIDGAALNPVEIGIGISSGPAVTGGFRTHGRTTYAAVGDCAVQAARIQAQSGAYGPAVIVGEETRKSAERGFAFLEVDFIAVVQDESPTKLYALLGNPVMRASPKFRALTTFHDHIFQSMRTQQWTKARELIEECRRLSGASQKLYDLHLARIGWYEQHPPGEDWDGAFRPILK